MFYQSAHVTGLGKRCPLDLHAGYLLYFSYLGGVAQLARAFAWHARGQGFDSPHLHESFSEPQTSTIKEDLANG